jgi:hypothetical protein
MLFPTTDAWNAPPKSVDFSGPCHDLCISGRQTRRGPGQVPRSPAPAKGRSLLHQPRSIYVWYI